VWASERHVWDNQATDENDPARRRAVAYALGIDVGGTKILAGVIDLERGAVISTAKKKTKVGSGAADLIRRIAETAEDALAAASSVKADQVEYAGVGIAGQVDRARGVLIRGPNLGADIAQLPIADQLEKALKRPVLVGNDVEVATIGEHRFGAGHGHSDLVCIFVGTGIGGGIIRNGKFLQGATDSAGEIGHAVIEYNGRFCGCGGRGHLEAYASRSAITRTLVEELRRGHETKLRAMLPDPLPDGPENTIIRSQMIAQAISQKDPFVVDTVTDGARYLAAGLTAIINFYNPPRIVLGGGLVDAVDLYFEVAARRALEESLVVARATKIVRSKLGDNAGIVGAALLQVARGG
jgi:glucokinase